MLSIALWAIPPTAASGPLDVPGADQVCQQTLDAHLCELARGFVHQTQRTEDHAAESGAVVASMATNFAGDTCGFALSDGLCDKVPRT